MSLKPLMIMFDPDLLGEDFIEAIEVVTSKKSAKRMNKIQEMEENPKLDYFWTDIITHEKMPDLLKQLGNNDNDSEDSKSDASSESDKNDDNRPEEVYVVSPVEHNENDEIDIDYENEIEVFIDKADADTYIAARKRDPLFRNVDMVCVLKTVCGNEFVKTLLENKKNEYGIKKSHDSSKKHHHHHSSGSKNGK